ncbi:MAG TPA: hypothetical protein VE077_12990 [Candidatus Methylomirabilis sp.]|nr:hypothetical protein [Candidatus Methylomirabilis sp.]
MTLADLFFLASVLFVAVCFLAMVVAALDSRMASLRRWAKFLFAYIAVYALALIAASLLSPRRVYPAGERRCWDDWCATALRVVPEATSAPLHRSSGSDMRIWVAEINVSSAAKRVRQSAPDARAELEDEQGALYQPCAAPLANGTAPPRSFADPLGPGGSFPVLLPFRLPMNEQPAGIVMHHGDFPGDIIIGSDSSVLHRPA